MNLLINTYKSIALGLVNTGPNITRSEQIGDFSTDWVSSVQLRVRTVQFFWVHMSLTGQFWYRIQSDRTD